MTTDATDRELGPSRKRPWPVLAWVPGYQASWLRPDIVAGLTVCAILVPEGMAYAQLAGVPPEAAFYAAPAGLLLYAMLGTSRQLVVAVSSAIAIMSAGTISLLAPAGSAEYVTLTAALALLAGLVSVVAGLLKLGRVAQFFSESVLVGFVFGLALLITIKQIPKLLGIEAHGESAVQVILAMIPNLDQTDPTTLVVGVLGIACMVLVERFTPRIPAALVVMLASIAASVALSLESDGVAVVGPLPAGLTGPTLPGAGLETLPLLLSGAVGIALVAFAEAVGPANEFAQKHGGKIDPDRELIALGAANMGAGMFSGFPIGSSLSKSAANERAGAKTPMSLVTAAAATALVALFLTPLFAPLPEATLGAVVVVAVSGMMKFEKMRRMWDLRRVDFWLAAIALAGVLLTDTLVALLIAVVLSLGLVVWRASEARLTFLGRPRGSLDPVELRADPSAAIPGLLIVRPDELLFFANASSVRDAIARAAVDTDPPVHVVLLDLSLTPEADIPTIEALDSLRGRLEREGITLWLAQVRPPVRDLLERSGVLARLGADAVHPLVVSGIVAYLRSTPESRDRIAAMVDLLDYVKARRAQPRLTQAAVELLDALGDRLEKELADAAQASTDAPHEHGSSSH